MVYAVGPISLASDVPIIPNNYFDMPLVNTGSTVIHPSVDFLMFAFTKREFLPLQVIREKSVSVSLLFDTQGTSLLCPMNAKRDVSLAVS